MGMPRLCSVAQGLPIARLRVQTKQQKALLMPSARFTCPVSFECIGGLVFGAFVCVQLTVVEADGILVATPSGSTAYSLSAGGSICLCTVPALLFTPICPHSLSFRPVMFPDSSAIKLVVPNDARASAWAHFDGRDSIEVCRGDFVVAKMSEWPMPLINKTNTASDWVHSITQKLNWNVRGSHQLPLSSTVPPLETRATKRRRTDQAETETIRNDQNEFGTVLADAPLKANGKQ